jgi:putative aminopeptidase FrvX
MSIPTRYIHSPSEMVDFRDCENGAKLIAAIVARPFSL